MTSFRYHVQVSDFIDHHGRSLVMKEYKGSVCNLVHSVYPDYNYVPWLFATAPRGFYEKKENRQHFVDWLVLKVGVKEASELQYSHFHQYAPGLIVKYGNSPQRLLQSLQPNENEDVGKRRKYPQNYWVTKNAPLSHFHDTLGNYCESKTILR